MLRIRFFLMNARTNATIGISPEREAYDIEYAEALVAKEFAFYFEGRSGFFRTTGSETSDKVVSSILITPAQFEHLLTGYQVMSDAIETRWQVTAHWKYDWRDEQRESSIVLHRGLDHEPSKEEEAEFLRKHLEDNPKRESWGIWIEVKKIQI